MGHNSRDRLTLARRFLEPSNSTGAIAPVPRISAEFERSGPGTCPEFLSRGLGTLSRRRFSRGLAMSHRTAFSQEWPPPGPRGRSVHPEDNALGRRLDPPDSSSSVPLILRWMALILPLAQAIRWPRGLVGGRRVLDGAWSGRVGFGRSSIHTDLHNSVF